MNKKSLILVILLVFITIITANLIFAADVTDNTTLEKSDNISNTIQVSETINSGSNSSTIQDKINSLNDGDTLNFESGEYNNISIYINKSITINGNGAILKGYDTPSANNTPEKIKTPIPSGGYGLNNFAILFIVNTHHVTLNNITFIGGANSGKILASSLVYAYNVTNININNNVFDGGCTGIYLNLCKNGIINENIVKNQGSTGILNFASAKTIIANNTVTNAINHGIDVRHQTGPNATVINNTIVGSKEGIYLMHSKGHVATKNTIINSTLSSITCYGSSNININNNKLQYSRIGILLASSYSNITIGENEYKLYRLPMPPIFTYYVAEAKSDYQNKEDITGTYTDITKNGPSYTANNQTPEVNPRIIDYSKILTPTGNISEIPDGANSSTIQSIINNLKDGDAIKFAENGKYYNISIYTTKNIKIIGNNATLYGLENANMSDMPAEIKNLGIIYLAVLYSANNTNVSISNLNIVSRYPDHKILQGTTPTNPYKTAGIYAMKSENIVITNCKVNGASFGIMLHFMAGVGGCANAIVTNNYITNQYTYGILNFGSKSSYIANNKIVNAKWHGIDVRHQMGPNIVVYNNTVIGSSEGIYLMHSHGHKVYNNTIINSTVSSISIYGSVDTKINNIYLVNNNLKGSRVGILLGGGNQNVTIGVNNYNLDAQKSGDKPGFGVYLVQTQDTYSDEINVPGTYNDQKTLTATIDELTTNKVKLTLKDNAGKPASKVYGTITINNNNYTLLTDNNGSAIVNVTLNYGTTPAIITTLKDFNYHASNLNMNLTIPKPAKEATKITAKRKHSKLKRIKNIVLH